MAEERVSVHEDTRRWDTAGNTRATERAVDPVEPTTPQDDLLDISLVLPVYNEGENLPDLVRRLLEVTRELPGACEIVLVDDGSSDNSADLIRESAEAHREVRGVLLRRNFGQSAAMTAGFQHARGRIVVTMDSDLQNDPADIPEMLKKLDEGYDLVAGWRKDRQDRFLDRKLPSQIANWMIGRFTGVRLHDYGCSLKVFRRELTEHLILYGELHRFIPVLLEMQGARITEMPVRHHPRTRGKSKYGIGRLPKVFSDLVLMWFFQRFATRPLQFFGRLGGFSFLGGAIINLFLFWDKFVEGHDIGTRPALLAGVLLVLVGILLVSVGLVAELVVRAYYENTGRRIYTVRDIIA